ncbi:MAG: BREX-1 system adenine-specific DNA-methyltransferase PglX [Thermodesulfovibrio sp.]|nr:BREX-1 system adenine-specific DNA-methyltransferase PglX [Thermodesulfovibrio sp.]
MPEIIETLVEEFSLLKLSNFLMSKNPNFTIYDPAERLYQFETEKFTEIYKIGKLTLNDGKELLSFSVKTAGELTERSSKKSQYELAKNLLKVFFTPCGIFVFYDVEGNFRFSLVYTVYSGTRATFSHYRRYTYYVAKNKPYRTFLKALTEATFDTLENIISAFSTQPLTKEFYTEIQNWYAWALRYCNFPGGILEENLIRLLTRLIFVWFLKERKLIPEEIFDPEFLENTVLEFGKKSYYYNVILQNLFFATLNRYPQDRKFTKNGDFFTNREEYGVKTLYRYKDKILIDEKDFIEIFSAVPFINGGLFECLDDNGNYIDGFTRREQERAKLPDFLFFSDEQNEDLTDFYGERKKARVRGLINILKDYNFTADESSPIDVEVSLDPELLGHIFENLLASYNPETQTTARKATGSYYTPKEIVDFMVEESLLEYLKTKTGIDEERLRNILSYSEESIDLNNEEKDSIIKAVDNLKIIDPSVGSGAFPMGMVHKLVHVLSKIDPENKLWYELQFQKALHEVEEVLRLRDKTEREKLLKEVNDNFDQTINYPDYARKLYIIENSIYGVDIQPIAIQICKLRFFLSLLIDQKVDLSKPNFGIKPLPHLETKFVSANTLIGLKRPSQRTLESEEIINLKRELKKLYKRHFTIKTRNEKKRLAEKAKEIRENMKNLLLKGGWGNENAEKIAHFDIFSQTATADWFDPEWMFGVEDGFDIVIGNPPYGNLINKYKNKESGTYNFIKNSNFYSYSTLSDISSPFIERGIQLLRKLGNIFYIITYAITFNKDFSGNRLHIHKSFQKTKIYIFDRDKCRIFENMSQSVAILMCIKKDSDIKEGIYTSRMFREMPDVNSIEISKCDNFIIPIKSGYKSKHRLPKIGEKINQKILEKLFSNSYKVSNIILSTGQKIWIRTSGNYWYNAFDKKPYDSTEISEIYIDKLYSDFFILLMNSSLFYFWFRIYGDGRHMNRDILEAVPIPSRDIVIRYSSLLSKMIKRFMERLFSVFESDRNRFRTSEVKEEIDLLDLVLCRYIYKLSWQETIHIINYDWEVRGGYKLSSDLMNVIFKILQKQKDCSTDTSSLEKQIDHLVYQLYDLTPEEIEIVEGYK